MSETLPTPDLPAAVLGEQTRLQVPSLPEWINPTVEFLRQKATLCGACQPTRANKLLLALHEALTNAVVHGNLEIASELKEHGDAFATALAQRSADPHYAGRAVRVDVDYDGQRCTWAITDEGQGFDFERYLSREMPDETEVWLSSGRGILLMRAFLDEVRYEAGGRRAVLALDRSSGAERREHPRQPLRQRVRVAPIRDDGTVDWEAAHEAVSHDLSESGIAVLQARLARADRLILGLEVEGQPIYLPAEVRHVRALDEGFVELGCRFLAAAPPGAAAVAQDEAVAEAVAALLRTAAPALPPHERRAQPRAAYTERIEVHGPPGTPPVVGFARDLSKSGIAFITTTPLPFEPRTVVLRQGQDAPVRLRAQIVRCSAIVEGFYDVAARFLAVEAAGA